MEAAFRQAAASQHRNDSIKVEYPVPFKTNRTNSGVPIWCDPKKRIILIQISFLIVVAGISFWLFNNVQHNLRKQAIASGFNFLTNTSSFEIGESLINYSSTDSYGRAILVGLLNTLKVSLVGILLAVLIGVFVGIFRLSSNWLLATLAGLFVETLRNVPMLLQLFFWYAVLSELLPKLRNALNPLPGVFLSNRGLFLAVPEFHPVYTYMILSLFLAGFGAWWLNRWARNRQERTGQTFPALSCAAIMFVVLPLLIWAAGGAPLKMDVPRLKGFNFIGGMVITPEYTALLLGLVLYTGAFIAEIVRAGIQSVNIGQVEAARSVGLKTSLVLRLVVLPQALRVIVPPLTSQMLNLTKNSSLAIAIGYPDLVAVTNTTINQTGQAIEGVAIMMVVYLFFSLLTSLFMNWYNKRIALIEN